MLEWAGALASVALPWLAGTLAVLALARGRGVAPAYAIGYGYLVGAFATTLAMRAFDLAGIRWSALPLGALLLLVCAGLGWSVRHTREAGIRPAAALRLRDAERPLRLLGWVCLALVVVRLGGLALEVLWRPLLPWDAWAQWATKARVWYEYRSLAPFVSAPEWLRSDSAMRFVDMHSHYPGTVPLLQVWTNLWLGHWNESLMNLPWIATGVALALAFHVQLRRAGAGPVYALVCTYLLLSLPFLDVHLAIAGVADIFVAASYALAAMSLWRWAATREPTDLVLGLAMAIVCASVKVEGMLWAATLLPGVLVAWRRRLGLALIVAAVAAAIIYLLFGPARLRLLGYVLETRFRNVSLPLLQHMFVMDNWHLLWYVVVATLAFHARRLFAPQFAPMTATMLAGWGFVFVVFFFSNASGGVDDETLVNRLPFHFVPALAYYLAVLWLPPAGARRNDTAAETGAGAATGG